MWSSDTNRCEANKWKKETSGACDTENNGKSMTQFKNLKLWNILENTNICAVFENI